ncbi:MAG: c-type cytochrome [Planctomycetes bacterium]|nr:c-type cytochrome [Planctomycetota bacterium]
MTNRTWLLCVAVSVGCSVVLGQNGDHQGETQPDLPSSLVVPPSPALSAEDEARTFRVADGLKVELVASEPLVEDPVAFAFDADGSLWVVEMRGYMPDVDGKGEAEPKGRIAHLFDDDGDGKMDRRVTFLDGLVLPRAVAPTRGGVLVIAPPKLLFARDEDGDGVAQGDEVVVVDQGLGGIASPEHAVNALLPTLDNAWYCANVPWRYVWRGGKWVRERTSAAGQWGATKDDAGRVYTNNNSDPLRVDAVSGVYAARNPNMGNAKGVNERVVDDMSPRPARMNVGVNRGYQKGQLNADYRLASVTGACAPWVFRGTAMKDVEHADEFRGNAYVCEPCGNLVLRYRLLDTPSGGVKGVPVRNRDGLDWLTSTDERFRPVWLCDGPDGAMYVCDMYRGLIQHRLFVTSWLRKQVLARGLEQPVGKGRIWRVVAARREKRKVVKLDGMGVGELVASLGSGDGWVRDTAQRLLVEEHDGSAEAHRLLRAMVEHGAGAGRVQALWTLSGMGGVTKEVVCGMWPEEGTHPPLVVGQDLDTWLVMAAVVVSEGLAAKEGAVMDQWMKWARAPGNGGRVVRAVMLSLGNVATERGLKELMGLARETAEWEEMRSAAVSGLCGRELDALRVVVGGEEWSGWERGRAELVEMLARCVVREGRGDRVEGLVGLCAEGKGAEGEAGKKAWIWKAMVKGVLAGRPKDALGGATWVKFGRKPAVVILELDGVLAWPGKAGVEELVVRELGSEERARFERGTELYEVTCVQCHLGSGLGQTGQAPPLRGSRWMLGDVGVAARVLLGGLKGEVELDGERWDGEMPAVGYGDEDVAALLTYVRREWGNGAEPVTAGAVAKVREEVKERKTPWTVKELEGVGK